MKIPELEGTISTDDFKLKVWLEVHEYQIPVVVDGVYYCHNFPTGVMGKPISGDNIGRALLIKK